MNRIQQIIEESEMLTISKSELLEGQDKLTKVLEISDNSGIKDFEYPSRPIKPTIDYAHEALLITGKFRATDIAELSKKINSVIPVREINFKAFQNDTFKHSPNKESVQSKEWKNTLKGTSNSVKETAHYIDITVNSLNEFINYANKIAVVGDPRIKLDINIDPYAYAALSEYNPHKDPRQLDLSKVQDTYEYKKLYSRR